LRSVSSWPSSWSIVERGRTSRRSKSPVRTKSANTSSPRDSASVTAHVIEISP
jgi:hypothetical protein